MTIKIQCPCGVKYAFEVTAESAATPVRFVCQHCGQDSSAFVNEIIIQQVAALQPASQAAPPQPVPAQPPEASPTQSPPAEPSAKPRLRVDLAKDKIPAPESTKPAVTKPIASQPQSAPAAPPPSSPLLAATPDQLCLKHVGEKVVAECLVCHKPLCPKCMELFGYVCSAYCQAQAEKLQIDLPVYQQKKTVVEARYWRKVRRIALGAVGVVLLLLGVWAWYAHVASYPKIIYSVSLPATGEESETRLIAPDQVLLRQGSQLTRYDVRKKTQIWSTPLLDKKAVAEAATRELAREKIQIEKWKAEKVRLKRAGKLEVDEEESEADQPISDTDQLQAITRSLERTWISKLKLHLQGQEVWIVSPNKIARYNWENGQVEREISIPATVEHFEATDQALFCVSQTETGRQVFTRISWPGAEVQTVQGPEPPSLTLAEAKPDQKAKALLVSSNAPSGIRAGASNPSAKAAAIKAAQGMATRPSGALITPAPPLSAVADDSDEPRTDSDFIDASGTRYLFAGQNIAQFTVKLLEKKVVEYAAMKARPKESELDKLSGANATAAMNEILNEWQEERTGGKRQEDESRYSVSLQRLPAEGAVEWNSEVVGPPELFALKTVDVLVAGKTVIVLDKANKKLWESKITYPIARQFEMERPLWQLEQLLEAAPCVERGSRLYLFDQGVLTAFELASGAVHWRLTSVGISRLHFDEKGLLYVATTSAGADTLKYSQQVDVSRKTKPVLLKVDPANGKILWRIEQTGEAFHFTGKFLYAVETIAGSDVPVFLGGAPSHVRIYRLNPRNGDVIWEYYEKRSPLAMDFQNNTFQLLFNNELEILKFMSL